MPGRIFVTEIVLLAGESDIFDLDDLDIPLVDAMRYIADRVGADFVLCDQPSPSVRGDLKNSLDFRYKIMTHRPKDDLLSHLAKGLTPFVNLADWVGSPPCAFASRTGLRLTRVRAIIEHFYSTNPISVPSMRRVIRGPDNIIRE